MIRPTSIVFLGLLAFVSFAKAQNSDFLDLNEAIIRSLQNNLNLQVEGVEVRVARADVTIAEAAFDATLFASGSQRGSRTAGYRNFEGDRLHNSLIRAGVSKFFNSGTQLQLTSNYARNSNTGSSLILNPAHTSDLSMSLRQSLLEGRGSEVNLIPLHQAELNVEIRQLILKQRALATMFDTESAYWDLAYAHEVKKVRIASLEVAEKLLEENRERERVGLATNIDVLQSQVFLATSEESVLSADALIADSQDNLYRQMGSNHFPDSYVPVSTLPDISTEEIGNRTALSTILASNPIYLRQKAFIEGSELDIKALRNATLPSVDLVAGVGFSGLDDSWIDSYGSTLERDGYDWSAGIEFRIPWGQRADKARYQQGRNFLYREQLLLDDIEQDIKVTNRSNWRNWVTGIERVKAAGVSLNLATEQFDREQTKYESGLATFRELLEARNDQDEANLRFISSILEAMKAQIANMSLDTSLPRRYGLTWEVADDLITPPESP